MPEPSAAQNGAADPARSRNPLTRLAVWLGSRPWVMRRSTQIIWLDRVAHRLSRDRFGLLAIAGVPSLTLIHTGRKSGLPRRTNLLCQPRDEHPGDLDSESGQAYVIVGSNWGRKNHPAWSYNLIANPNARILVRGEMTSVTARQLTGAEYQRIWAELIRFWPGYTMERRLASREFLIFLLCP